MKRSTKFYRKNEAEVMQTLGLEPTKGSGAGWIEKSDGQNSAIIAELKSTDAQSIRVKLADILMNEHHAIVAHKIPIFVIQFLESNETFVMARPIDLPDIAQFLECGQYARDMSAEELVSLDDAPRSLQMKVIKAASREEFYADREREQQNWRKR